MSAGLPGDSVPSSDSNPRIFADAAVPVRNATTHYLAPKERKPKAQGIALSSAVRHTPTSPERARAPPQALQGRTRSDCVPSARPPPPTTGTGSKING